MKSITQDIKYYQAILSYADQHGVTKAAIKYRTYRQFIYRLRNRYDGTPEPRAEVTAPPSSPQRTLRQGDRSHSSHAQTSSQYRACSLLGAYAYATRLHIIRATKG